MIKEILETIKELKNTPIEQTLCAILLGGGIIVALILLSCIFIKAPGLIILIVIVIAGGWKLGSLLLKHNDKEGKDIHD